MKILRVILLILSLIHATLADEVTVVKIFDGDTILVNNKGTNQVIRFIGIDTPEAKLNPKLLEDSLRTKKSIEEILKLGELSKHKLQSMISEGDKVTLEYDVERNNGNRILAYVYNQKGEMLNLKLLESGFATIMTVPPNVRYVKQFEKAQKLARENRLGHWNE